MDAFRKELLTLKEDASAERKALVDRKKPNTVPAERATRSSYIFFQCRSRAG